MKTLLNVPLMLTLLPSAVLAQTPTGQDVNATVSGYTYTEPSATSISIHGPKVGGEYTATLSLNERRHWFAQGNVRGMIGIATYTGWCSPYLIRPNNTSSNGYELDIGDPSPCSENGDRDWYLEGRALAGKDVIAMDLLAVRRSGAPSFVERDDRRRWVPDRRVSLRACRRNGAHERCVDLATALQLALGRANPLPDLRA